MMQNPVKEKTIVADPTKLVKKSQLKLWNLANKEVQERFTPTKR
jgi:hypothetical protein